MKGSDHHSVTMALHCYCYFSYHYYYFHIFSYYSCLPDGAVGEAAGVQRASLVSRESGDLELSPTPVTSTGSDAG